jgi:4-hydroxy-tetrahydrodipicolinate synthase
MLYNIPSTTKVSIPLDVVSELAGHTKLLGIKDSENDPKRLEELLRRLGGNPNFAIFVGVGALMAHGLKLGAEGIVPSVGNLIPEVCRRLCACAESGDWTEAQRHADRMNEVAAFYQRGRSLGESLAVLKGALSIRGLCESYALPSLRALEQLELEALRQQMGRLGLLNGAGTEQVKSRPKKSTASASQTLASGGGLG